MVFLLSCLGLGPIKPSRDAPPPCLCDSQDSITIVEKVEVIQTQREKTNMDKVQSLVQTITETHARLLKLPDLGPGKEINELLGNLVEVCSEIHDQDTVQQVLNHAGVKAVLPWLRKICAEAESCLESHWAAHILKGSSPDEVITRLESFPYYANYQDLARLELCAILSVTKTAPSRIAFIGSGPLPLTSLCLLDALKSGAIASGPPPPQQQKQPSRVVLNIDFSEAAIAASLRLCLALGARGAGMEFMCADAASTAQSLAEFDVVYMAALVGMSQANKEAIVLHVAGRMRPGALLVVRSAWGLRTCLYPEVDLATERLLGRLEPCVVVHPYGQVVNSVLVARVRGDDKREGDVRNSP
ncbi:Nicotianamine synthase [Lasiosphaeria ovina]|uniref:Nicotianamine synthase n=1 Tax=Lasiosphaeria ovina TaxID=92902 RepID=A0AAE0JWI5_9PEZI|nr:Nicotianamine synthase [Lasiosphaeria ovina]